MNHLPLRRALASAVCLSLLLACPGPDSYAAAQSVAHGASASPATGPAAVPVVGFGGASFAIPTLMPSLGLMPGLGAPSAPAPTTAAPGVSASAASLKVSAARPTAPAKVVSAAAKASAVALTNAGPITDAAPASASDLGRKLEAALTNVPSLNAGSDLSAPAAGKWGVLSESRQLARHDSLSEKSTEPITPGPSAPAKTPLTPKLIATAIALIPACFFGLPILAGHSLIQIPLYLALALPLAAMPFLGKSSPKILRSVVGHALFYNGLVLLFTGSAIYVGLIALLDGWGFNRWVERTQEKDVRFDKDETRAFFGALGASVAVGAVWAGFLGGWIGWGTLALAAATSPLLLKHLPPWAWKGMSGFLGAFPKSMESFHNVASFWHNDTKFLSNLQRHKSYWLKQTHWHGVWLTTAIWMPVRLIQAAEWILSIALGAAIGLSRAPFAFAAAAVKEAWPYSKTTIVMDRLLKGWSASSEGSKTLFDRLVSGLKPAMDESAAQTGRPTAKAVGAFTLARAVQVFWLTGVLAMNLSGLSFLYGAYQGVRAAFAPAKPYRLYTQGFEIDEPLNGGNANRFSTTQGVAALRSLLNTLTAEFDRAKVPYDKAAFTVEALQGSGIQLVDPVSNRAYVSVFGVLALTEQQAAVASRYALDVQYNPPAHFARLP